MGVKSRLQAVLHVLVERVGGEGDDGNGLGVRTIHSANRDGSLQSVHLRHTHIHQDRIVPALRVRCEHLHRHLAVLGVFRLDLAHRKHLAHDLGVDLHVLRQQHPAAFQHCLAFRCTLMLSTQCPAELIHHILRYKGLCDETVDARADCLLLHIFPAVGGQHDDSGLAAQNFTDAAGGLHAVHLRHLAVD